MRLIKHLNLIGQANKTHEAFSMNLTIILEFLKSNIVILFSVLQAQKARMWQTPGSINDLEKQKLIKNIQIQWHCGV